MTALGAAAMGVNGKARILRREFSINFRAGAMNTADRIIRAVISERSGGLLAERSGAAKRKDAESFNLDLLRKSIRGYAAKAECLETLARYSVGDWPNILRKVRLNWVSDWNPTSYATSLILRLGLSKRALASWIRARET